MIQLIQNRKIVVRLITGTQEKRTKPTPDEGPNYFQSIYPGALRLIKKKKEKSENGQPGNVR